MCIERWVIQEQQDIEFIDVEKQHRFVNRILSHVLFISGLALLFQIANMETHDQDKKTSVKQAPSFFQFAQCDKQAPDDKKYERIMEAIGSESNHAPASVIKVASNVSNSGVSWITSQSLQRKIAQRNKTLNHKAAKKTDRNRSKN